MAAVDYAITYHVEGPRDAPSKPIFDEITRQIELADRLGIEHAWFAEHHGHAHFGHSPHPLAYCLYLAGRTERIKLGAAVVCVNLHHPVLVGEQIAMLDVLSGGRASVGLGSGSTPAEFAIYGVAEMAPEVRRARFVEMLDAIERACSGELLPKPLGPIAEKLWIGANSPDSARLAGERGYGLQLSNLRTTDELRGLISAYHEGRAAARGGEAVPSSRSSPGQARVAASAPLYLAESDARALEEFGPALEVLRRESTRGAAGGTPREQVEALRFTVGSPERAVDELLRLREQLAFTTVNLRPRWRGQTPEQVERSLELFAERVRPKLDAAWSKG